MTLMSYNTVAVGGEWIAVQNESSDVDIFDGEGTIRLTMSYDEWERFTADAMSRRII